MVDDGDELGIVGAGLPHGARPGRPAGGHRAAASPGCAARRPAERRVAIVLSAYPTKRSRLGNAVGLDTPASAIRLLDALHAEGYRVDRLPGRRRRADGRAGRRADLRRRVAQRRRSSALAVGGLDVDRYADWFATLPADARTSSSGAWGPAPGRHRIHDGRLVFSGVDLGNVLVAIQPPRGYGDDPVAVYHSPNLPAGAPLPGLLPLARRGVGRRRHRPPRQARHARVAARQDRSRSSAGCWPDAALGDVPFFYPFVVNDPGEGAQAKRRAHAVVIDHLLPPMTRADTYDEMAQLEQLFDEYSQIQSLDPSQAAGPARADLGDRSPTPPIDRDLGLDDVPDDGRVRRRDRRRRRLPVRAEGRPDPRRPAHPRRGPEGDALVDLVLAITRLPPRQDRRRCGPRSPPSSASTRRPDARSTPSRPRAAHARRGARRARLARRHRRDPPTVAWVCDWLVPNLARADRRDRQPARRARRAATCPPGRAVRSPAAAPTCCRPAATSTRSTPRRCPPS